MRRSCVGATILMAIVLAAAPAPAASTVATTQADVQNFLGGSTGILVYIDAADGDKLKYVDLSQSPLTAVTLDSGSCDDPIVSADGTRVCYDIAGVLYARYISGGDRVQIAPADKGIGYWYSEGGQDYIVYCDSTGKGDYYNGSTWKVAVNGITPSGTPTEIYTKAYDGGISPDGVWIGEAYGGRHAYNLTTGVEYGTFYRSDGSTEGQCCNASFGPLTGPHRMMTLVLPHTYYRIWEYNTSNDRWEEWKTFTVHTGEWQRPDWSTHPDYSTANVKDGNYDLYIVRHTDSAVLKVIEGNVDNHHLWVGAPSSDPFIVCSPASLQYDLLEGASNPPSDDVLIQNSGSGTLDTVTYSDDASWLTVTHSGSGDSQVLTNSVDLTGLVPGSYSATVTVDAANASNTATYMVQLNLLALRQPENPANTTNGLDVSYYALSSPSLLPDFTALTAYKTDTVTQINYASTDGNFATSDRAEDLGAVFAGYVDVPTDGLYTFYTTSDDGSALYIGTTKVVDNDGAHGMEEQSGQIALAAGKHAFSVEFFENSGGAGLIVSYEGPGITKTVIPGSELYRLTTSTTLALDTSTLSFTGVEGGANPAAQDVNVSNTGDGTLDPVSTSTSYGSGSGWLTVAVSGSGNAQTLTNSVDTTGLSAGTYTATVTVSCANADNSPLTYDVTLEVSTSPPVLTTITVTPATATIDMNATASLTAAGVDQYGDPFAATIGWSVSGGGSMSPTSSGSDVTSHSSTFQSDGTVGTFTVTALSGSVSGTAQVTVQDTQAPTLSISAPVNGATVYQTVTVSGTASDNVGVTQVEVRVDSGTWNIATGTTSWQWDLDTTGLSDGAHTINVRALDAAGNATTDSVSVTVDNAPALTLLSPLGGESWAAGSTQIIRFDSHLFSDVTIRYSLNAGGNWTDIEGSWAAAEGENAYTWTVPNATTDHARVLVQAYSGESPVQSADFSITGGTQWLTLTAPVGGETLSGNDLATVTWDCGGVDTVRLMLSLDGGRTWSDVATVRDSQLEWQNYAWSVPNVASDFCILRVSDLSGNVSSQSSPFAIEPVTGTPGAVEVTNVRLNWSIPTEATDLTSVTVGGTNCPVVDGRVQCDIAVPADVRTMMVEIAGTDGAGVAFSRLIRIDVADRAPPIDGLNVSKQELVSFLDGREGVLVWVDINAGRRIKVLDFRAADPVVRVLNDHTSCVNPIVSPDGTRVVYSVGNANGTKSIYVARLSDGARQLIATGDVGYWQFDAGNEYIVYCDWSSSANNGTDGKTWRRRLTAGTITPDGTAVEIHSRAMDAGVTGDGQWLGHVYSELYVWDLVAGVEYGPGDFFLLEGDVATSQTCNGSMSPSGTAAIMELVIPHEWVRVFTYESSGDVFRESTRLQLPAGMVEWEFPEWSTDAQFATAVLQPGDLVFRLHLVRIEAGDLVPQVLQVTHDDNSVSFSHLYVAP